MRSMMTAPKIEKEKTNVVIYTHNHRIEGTIYLPRSARLTDFMNATTGLVFLPVTDAKIYALSEEKPLYSVDFLSINKNHINMIFPRAQ
jgi:hypothetical protein